MSPKDTCELVGDFFGILMQLVLALLAFSSLYYKWFRENPRRKFVIWLLDVSKQAGGALVQHFFNLFFSIVLFGEMSSSSQCIWYFLSVMLDTTFGVLGSYFILKGVRHVAEKHRYRPLYQIGNYGDTNRPSMKNWLVQFSVWLLIILCMKVVISVFLLVVAPTLQAIAEFLFLPLYGHPKVELALVMIIVPVTMNTFQFWVCDNFLKRKAKTRRPVLDLTQEFTLVGDSLSEDDWDDDELDDDQIISNTVLQPLQRHSQSDSGDEGSTDELGVDDPNS